MEQDQPFPEVKEHLMKYLETRLDFDRVRPVTRTTLENISQCKLR